MATETPKKKRGPRRNYQEIVSGTVAYCQAAIDTCTGIRSTLGSQAPLSPAVSCVDARLDGQMDALRAVLKRLNGTKAEAAE